jgi:hypothetical protein
MRWRIQAVFLGVDLPFEGHVPALRDAEGLKNAHGGDFRGGVFAHDLADHQLQGQAVLALLLLGHVAQQAAHGQRIAGLLPLAQAQFQFQYAAVGCVWRKDARSTTRRPGRGGRGPPLRRGWRAKELFKRIEGEQSGSSVQAEASLPGGIGIEKLSRRAERGDHLAGVFEEVAIPLLRFAERLLLAQGRALVHGHGDQAGERASLVAQGGDVEGNGDEQAPSLRRNCASKLGTRLGGRSRTHSNRRPCARQEWSPAVFQCRRAFPSRQPGAHLRREPESPSWPTLSSVPRRGSPACVPRRIRVGEPAVEVDGHHPGADGVERAWGNEGHRMDQPAGGRVPCRPMCRPFCAPRRRCAGRTRSSTWAPSRIAGVRPPSRS